jgi:hypothetical protein
MLRAYVKTIIKKPDNSVEYKSTEVTFNCGELEKLLVSKSLGKNEGHEISFVDQVVIIEGKKKNPIELKVGENWVPKRPGSHAKPRKITSITNSMVYWDVNEKYEDCCEINRFRRWIKDHEAVKETGV